MSMSLNHRTFWIKEKNEINCETWKTSPTPWAEETDEQRDQCFKEIRETKLSKAQYPNIVNKISKMLLVEVIMELKNINYTIVTCISNCQERNMGLWKELEKTYYLKPITEE